MAVKLLLLVADEKKLLKIEKIIKEEIINLEEDIDNIFQNNIKN